MYSDQKRLILDEKLFEFKFTLWFQRISIVCRIITPRDSWVPACKSDLTLLPATRTSSQLTFPVDFFEHNQQLTEVEFGGNDLLQVYNGQQIKHRLNSTGMYVANTKVQTLSLYYFIPLIWMAAVSLNPVCFSSAWRVHCGGRQQQQLHGDDWDEGPGGDSGHRESSFIHRGLWTNHAGQPDPGSMVRLPLHQRRGAAGGQEALHLQ